MWSAVNLFQLLNKTRTTYTMKLTLLLVFIALCSQICWVACDAPKLPNGLSLSTTTTRKPWSKKFKDGLDNFFRGAAVIGTVQGALQNRKSHKHKPALDPKH